MSVVAIAHCNTLQHTATHRIYNRQQLQTLPHIYSQLHVEWHKTLMLFLQSFNLAPGVPEFLTMISTMLLLPVTNHISHGQNSGTLIKFWQYSQNSMPPYLQFAVPQNMNTDVVDIYHRERLETMPNRWCWRITATLCNTLQRTATHCNTLQHTTSSMDNDWRQCWTVDAGATLQRTATHWNALQQTATHCNTLHLP